MVDKDNSLPKHRKSEVAAWIAAIVVVVLIILFGGYGLTQQALIVAKDEVASTAKTAATKSAATTAATNAATSSATASATDGANGEALTAAATTISEVSADDPYATGLHHATIVVAGYGSIELELNANAAPITTSNFCHLVEQGFYNGLSFHRVIKGFMIQGGDPNANGTGGSDANIKGEFSANGVKNVIPHTRGTISMARSQDMDSASSQFFIMQEAAPSLDGQYAAFGHVTSGMEVVDAICDKTVVQDTNGTVDAADQPKIESITLKD